MIACRYVEENGLVTMLVAKRSVGVTPEMNLRERVTCMPLPSIRLPTLALKPRVNYIVNYDWYLANSFEADLLIISFKLQFGSKNICICFAC